MPRSETTICRKVAPVSLWQVDVAGKNLNTESPVELQPTHQRIWAVAFDNLSKRCAIGSESGEVMIYEVDIWNQLVTMRSSMRRIRKILFSDDVRYLAATTWASSNLLWDLDQLEKKLDELGLGFVGDDSARENVSPIPLRD